MKTGDLIRLIRGKSGLSQTDFGLAIGVARPTVAQWEGGKHSPRFDNVVHIVEKFKPEKSLSDKLLNNIGHNSDIPSISNFSVPSDPVSKINDLVSGLFDLVISGEITIRPGGDPEEIAKHLYSKIYGQGSLSDLVAEPKPKYTNPA